MMKMKVVCFGEEIIETKVTDQKKSVLGSSLGEDILVQG
jgi:hypothetical protein